MRALFDRTPPPPVELMDVVINGQPAQREVDCYEPNRQGFMEAQPKTKDGERAERLVSGEVHIIQGVF